MQRYMIERERPMSNRYFLLAALAVLMACGGTSYGPMSPGNGGTELATQTVVDPIGDTFNTGGKQWDLTAFTVSRDAGGVTAQLDFATDVLSPMSGDTSAIIGFVEFDLDQVQVTGGGSVVDEFRSDGGTTALGVDVTVDLSLFAADSTVGRH